MIGEAMRSHSEGGRAGIASGKKNAQQGACTHLAEHPLELGDGEEEDGYPSLKGTPEHGLHLRPSEVGRDPLQVDG